VAFDKGANVSALSPVIVVSNGATISPQSGTARNFATAQTYVVTAEDGKTTKTYTAQAKVSQ